MLTDKEYYLSKYKELVTDRGLPYRKLPDYMEFDELLEEYQRLCHCYAAACEEIEALKGIGVGV